MGVMLMEALSALADELSYLQDRVAAESTLDTATQALSLLRHTRLVDYEPSPPVAAATLIQFDVTKPPAGPSAELPAEPSAMPPAALIRCQAADDQGGTVDFVAGADFQPVAAGAGAPPRLDHRWNRYADEAGTIPQLVPYFWDASQRYLASGSTSVWIKGHGYGFYVGQELLIDTAGAGSGDPPVREIVQLTSFEQHLDPVGQQPAIEPQPVTLIRWAEGLSTSHDLTQTQIAGNLLPALQGQITEETFTIPGGPAPPGPPGGPPPRFAVARLSQAGLDDGGQLEYLYTLAAPLAWQALPAPDDGGAPGAWPALALQELASDIAGNEAPDGQAIAWRWVRWLLDADGAARVFTITPDRYSPARPGGDPSFCDYDGDGRTIRFGCGSFGRPPVPGTTFRARYLAGGGAAGNASADTILTVAPGDPASGRVWRCTNPFPATGGIDAETAAQIRDRAPQQFHNGLLSLTGPADYQSAALEFSPGGSTVTEWARWAIAKFRWTGSWSSAQTTVDPMIDEPAATQLSTLASLARVLRTRGLGGSDSSVAIARYLRLDLSIIVQADRRHRRPDVEAAVLARLDPHPGASGITGFFGRDRWAFGQPLDALALRAAIQSCPGVAGIIVIKYRGRQEPIQWEPLPDTIHVSPVQILRIDNDTRRPQHGLLFVTAEVSS
jgi:hypothetical protein